MKRHLFSFVLTGALLSACGGGSIPPGQKPSVIPPPVGTPSADRLTGKLAAWPYTSAALNVELLFNPDALGCSPVSVPAGGVVDLSGCSWLAGYFAQPKF